MGRSAGFPLQICRRSSNKSLELCDKYVRWYKGASQKGSCNHLYVSRSLHLESLSQNGSQKCPNVTDHRSCPMCPDQIIIAYKDFPRKRTGNRRGKFPVNPDKELVHLRRNKKIETDLSSYQRNIRNKINSSACCRITVNQGRVGVQR